MTEYTWINVTEQLVQWFGIIYLGCMFYRGAKDRADLRRFLIGNCIGAAYAVLYMLCYRLARMTGNTIETVVIYIWWYLFYLLSILVQVWSRHKSFGVGLFRGNVSIAVGLIVNTVLQNINGATTVRNLMQTNPLVYFSVEIGLIIVSGFCICFLLAGRMPNTEELPEIDSRGIRIFLLLLLLFSCMAWNMCNGMIKFGLTTVDSEGTVVDILRIYLQTVSIFVSAFVLIVLILFYRIGNLTVEKNMLNRLQQEKSRQYEFSKQTMDVVNQKCHDLKRNLQALEYAGDQEKIRLLEETRNAADFFNYVAKTGNEILDTILTEKGMICQNQNIRLTCTAENCEFGRWSVVDLYTVLANALDNAIECVTQYEEPEKRVIAVNMTGRNGMNNIMIENHFEGVLQFHKEELQTSKEDSVYHGYGVKSIRMIVKKYGGQVRIDTRNDTFCIQMLIPK